ncbi:MAG: methyltransferase domain-containing protein [Clostridia bacterium]|nr:methyltransferase domain-containing protein [Clostridia bacterium]
MTPPSEGRLSRLNRLVTALGGLKCLKCGQPLLPDGDAPHLRCGQGHSVDVNRKGYVNLLSRAYPGIYDARLFEARSRVLDAAYLPVAEALNRLLAETESTRILDAGCGEGWYLHRLLQMEPARLAAGCDLSADAIRRAAAWPEPILWCVADLRRLPFRDRSFDAVLDILSPADYGAFRRALRPGGWLIKVYPGQDYLREIRAAASLPAYQEGDVSAYLSSRAQVCRTERVHETVPLTEALWRDFLLMTPLTQGLDEAALDRLAEKPAGQMTFDLRVSLCRFPEEAEDS